MPWSFSLAALLASSWLLASPRPAPAPSDDPDGTYLPPPKTDAKSPSWIGKARLLQREKMCRFQNDKGVKDRFCHASADPKKPKEVFLLAFGQPKQMLICRGSRRLRIYPTGYGRRGLGKQREGDKKTPLGEYRITWVAARHEPRRAASVEKKLQRYQIRDGKAFCMPDKATRISHFRRDKGPKDERLWMKPYGGEFATVMAIDYPHAKDQEAGRTGSCIEIHASWHLRSSAGCILLWPHHILELYNCIGPQTRLVVLPKKPFPETTRFPR